VLDIVDGRRPGMHLGDVHFDKPEKSGEAIDPDSHTFAAFALLDAKLMHGIRGRVEGTFMVEDRATRVSHQLQRPAAKERQGTLSYLAPIRGKLLFAGRDGIAQQLQDVLARDAAPPLATAVCPRSAPPRRDDRRVGP
jgi:hypothetical protein